MKMYIPMIFLLISLACMSAQEMCFVYKDSVIRTSTDDMQTINNLKFNKHDSIMDFAFIGNFMVIRINHFVYRLIDMPVRRRDRLHLLLDEEAKTDSELKQI